MSGVIQGVPIFPANNIWNRRCDDMPVNASSATWIANSGTQLIANFNESGGIPINTSTCTDPLQHVTFTGYIGQSEASGYRIPLNARIENAADAHVLCYDLQNAILYELYGASVVNGAWQAYNGAIWPLNSNNLRPYGWTSTDAAGLPVAPGIVRYDEIYGSTNVISHALRLGVPGTIAANLWPATHNAPYGANPNDPPMGARLRLKSSFDITGYPPDVQVLLRALQQFGAFVADNGGNSYSSLFGATDSRWIGTNYHGGVASMPAISQFEYVDESAHFISWSTAQYV